MSLFGVGICASFYLLFVNVVIRVDAILNARCFFGESRVFVLPLCLLDVVITGTLNYLIPFMPSQNSFDCMIRELNGQER